MGVTSSVQQFQRKREQRPLIKTSQKSVPFWQLWKLPIRKKEVDELGIEASDHPYGEDVPLFDLISSVCSSLCHDSQKHDHPSVGLIWKDSHAGGQYGLTGSVFHSGGVSHGPRGPTSYYNSSKEAQDDLHIVDSLDIPTPDSQYLLDLIRHRHWGESVLIVDVGEDFSENILQATANLKTVNIIPAIGLNVHSMLKHEEIVLTLETVKFLEDKLLWHDELYTPLYPFKLPYSDFP